MSTVSEVDMKKYIATLILLAQHELSPSDPRYKYYESIRDRLVMADSVRAFNEILVDFISHINPPIPKGGDKSKKLMKEKPFLDYSLYAEKAASTGQPYCDLYAV